MTEWLCRVLEEGAAAEASGQGAAGLWSRDGLGGWVGSGCGAKAGGEGRRCTKKQFMAWQGR